MGKGSASEEIARIIKAHDGKLVRQNKHEFWKFPNGEQFTRSCTPSDVHAEDNALRDLKRILNLNGERGLAGERRERRIKHARPDQPTGSSPTLTGVLAEKLALAGWSEVAHRTEVAELNEHIRRLKRECRLKDKKLRWHQSDLRKLRSLPLMRLSRWLRGIRPRLYAWLTNAKQFYWEVPQ